MDDSLHFSPDGIEAANAGLFISRGRGTHPTRVIQTHELIAVRTGELGLFEGDSDYRLGSGEFLVLRPGIRHGGTRPYMLNLSFYWLHFQLNATASDKTVTAPLRGKLQEPERMEWLFRRFLDDQESGFQSRTEAGLLVALMLCETARSGGGAVREPAGMLAAKAMERMVTGFAGSVSPSVLARELGCNADYLGRLFRKQYGLSLLDSLHRLRIKEARSLLAHSALNIDEIAQRSGFNDSCYFRKIFKRHCGLSPMRFRKLHLRAHVNTV